MDLFSFLERGVVGRRGVRHRSVASGMCPDLESNPHPLGVWEDAPTT